jgi:hypothetical protein
MSEKVPVPPRKGEPKPRPDRNRDPHNAEPKSEQTHPPRDTRDTPAPNPNGKGASET